MIRKYRNIERKIKTMKRIVCFFNEATFNLKKKYQWHVLISSNELAISLKIKIEKESKGIFRKTRSDFYSTTYYN